MNLVDQDTAHESGQDVVTEKPLVDPKVWSKPPTLMELKQDLANAKPIHDGQVTKITEWLDNLNVTGEAKPKKVKGRSSIQPKLIRRQAEWRYAALSEPFLSTDDVFKVKPVTWEDRDGAKQNELVLNWQLNTQINKVKFIDEYVRTAVDEGTVIIWVGWEFLEEEYEAEVPDVQFVINPELAPLHEQIHEMMEKSPSEYGDLPDELKQAHEMTLEQGQPIEPQIIGKKTVTKKRTLANRPTLEVMDFRNVVLDPTAGGDPEKANFVVRTFESSIADLEKTGLYKNLDKINVTNNTILGTPDHQVGKDTQTFNFEDKQRQKIVVHEYWGRRSIDGSNKLVDIVTAWVGDTIIRMAKSPYPRQPGSCLPVVVEQYLPVRRSNYGEPDGALLEDNQKVVGAVTRGMIDLLGRSANAQIGTAKGMLDATNKRKFERGEDYEFNPNNDPRTNLHMHEYPEIPQSAPFMLQLMNMDAESLTGVKSFTDGGISGSALGDVAAAVRGALDAASKRELGILRRLAGGMVKIGRKLIAMNAELLSDEEVISVTNDQFVKVRREDLAGNFNLKLSISTAEEDNNKAEQLAFLLQTVGPNGDPGLTKMVLGDIMRLRKMPDLAHKIETFEPQPDPVQQKLQELEIAKIEADIAEVRAKTQKLLVDAGLHQAKIATEGAKAAHLKSDADLKNLDFVEQESGTHHAREMDKASAQARSQEQLAMVQHDLKKDENLQDRQFDLVQEYVKAKSKPKSKSN